MKSLVAWFANNGVAANLTALVIVVGGLMTVGDITQEVFPEFSTDLITVTVPYLGAAPEEVEEGVCIRVEEEIQSLEGIKKITSSASEGVGAVSIEVEPAADRRKLLEDIKTRVDAIDTFPEETEKPIIQELIIRRQVVNIAVSGNTTEHALKRLAERVRDEISALEGITQVELAATRPYEISIEISEEALRRWGLTFQQVAAAVRRSSLDLPGGSVKTPGGEVLLRTKGQAYTGKQFEDLVLLTRPDGTYLKVGDVAKVVDGFAETDQSARFDGKPAALVQVFRVGRQRALDIADKVKEYAREASGRMPEGVTLTVWQDDSRVLRSRLDLLLRNGRTGLILVLLILTLFLRLRLALWASFGLPIAFLGTLWLMPGLDLSINLISLFAFIVVLGILVDDAIVVGESIYTQNQQGMGGAEASIRGARRVAIPVIFGVLTTVAAFSPLTWVEGSTGKVMRVIPLIVIPCLLFSLVESLLILPSHLSHHHPKPKRKPSGLAGLWSHVQGAIDGSLEWVSHSLYKNSLEIALRWRYAAVALGISTLLLTAGLVGSGWVRFVFLPDVEADNVVAEIEMPLGTPVERTAAAVRRLEETADQVRREIDARSQASSVFRHMLSSIGEQPFHTAQGRNAGDRESYSGGNLGEVNIELAPSEERDVSSKAIADLWREKTGAIPDAVQLTFTSSLFSPGEPINVQLSAGDLGRLQAAADELKKRLAGYQGVYDIADSYRLGKREVKLDIKPKAELLGLTLADLAGQVRNAFYGEEAQRIQRGRDEIKVMVRYPEGHRRSLGDLEQMRIRTPQGDEVPFSDVALASYGRGFSTIRRVDRQRAINVTANVNETQQTANEVIADLESSVLPDLLRRYPSLTYSLEGRQREQQETLMSLGQGYIIALIAIFALLAIPLRSYVQPVIIMSAIPFGAVGAIWGHVLMGMDLTILSMFGLVALAGVVVNDSLVMVDFINQERGEGISLEKAIRDAGIQRFRAILLTSLTTFGGLTPLLLERSLQAQFLIPMAISLGFGVIFSTFVTLVLVPCGYLIQDDFVTLPRRIFKRKPSPEGSPSEAATRFAKIARG